MKKMLSFGEFQRLVNRYREQEGLSLEEATQLIIQDGKVPEPEVKQATYYQRLAKALKKRLRIRKAKEKLEKAKKDLQDAMRPQETE